MTVSVYMTVISLSRVSAVVDMRPELESMEKLPSVLPAFDERYVLMIVHES